MRKKFYILLSLFFLFFLAVKVGHRSFICFGMKSYLERSFPKKEDVSCIYDSCKWRGKTLLFRGVACTIGGKGGGPPLDIRIENLKVTLDFQWASFKFSPKIMMIRPKVIWKRKEGADQNGRNLYEMLNQWMFRTSLSITEGEVIAQDQVAIVSLTAPEGAEKGSLKIGKKGEKPALMGAFWKKAEALNLDISFLEFDIAWALKIGRSVFPKMCETVHVSAGILEGNCALSSTFFRPIDSLQYALSLKELDVSEKTYGTCLTIDRLDWKKQFDSKKGEHREESASFLENFWQDSMGEGLIRGMRVDVRDFSSNKRWKFNEIQGTFQLSSFRFPLVQLSGLYQGEREARFNLDGKENQKGEKEKGIDWSLEIFSEELIQATLSLVFDEKKPSLIEMDCKNLNAPLLDLLTHFLKKSVPFLSKVSIDSGKFSGKASRVIQNGALGSLKCAQWSALDVEMHFPFEKLTCCAKEISGKGEFDLGVPSPFQGKDWAFSISEGTFAFGKDRRLENISLFLSMDHAPASSPFPGFLYRESQKDPSLENSFSHLNGYIEGALFPESFPDLKIEGNPESKAPFILDVNLTLNALKDSLAIAGHFGGKCGKNEKDTLHVISEWNLDALKKGSIGQGLKWGEFKGEKISDRFVNLFLIFLNQECRLNGSLGVEGKWDSHSIEVTVDPTEAQYQSKYFDLRPQCKEGEKAPACTFFYSYENGGWVGTIPLKEAVLKQHSFGITFDSFTSEVQFEKDKFFFQNVEALSCNIRFHAEICVDLEGKDSGELTIRTRSIEAEAQDMIAFLAHFEKFKRLKFPLRGKISSPDSGLFLRAHIGEIEELLEWNVTLYLKEGAYSFSSTVGWEDLSAALYYSARENRVVIEKLRGTCALSAGSTPRFYMLSAPLLELDPKVGLTYDCRVEDSIHEICRISGKVSQSQGEYVFTFDEEHPRFYGAEIDVKVLSFKKGRLHRAEIETTLSALDLVHHLDFLSCAGILPLKSEKLRQMRGAQMQGTLALKMGYDVSQELFSFDASGNELSMGSVVWDHLAIHGHRKGDTFNIDRFEVGQLSLFAQMEREKQSWRVPHLEMQWKKNFLKGREGSFNQEDKRLTLPIEEMRLELDEVKELFSSYGLDREAISGTFFAKGEIIFDFANGFQNSFFDSHLKWVVEDFGPGKLRVESSKSCALSYHPSFGFFIGESYFNVLHPQYHEIWAKCEIAGLNYAKNILSVKQMRVVVPPEMVSFLGQTRLFPHLQYEEERLIVYDYPIQWENQIEAVFDFSLGEKKEIKGCLKEGYYWIGSKAWHLNDCLFDFKNDSAFLCANVACNQEVSFNISADVTFLEQFFKSRVEIKDSIQSRKKGPLTPLIISTDWNPNEGFFIQTVEGGLCGMQFSFHHNPKRSAFDKMALTGQMKMNFPRLFPLLPEEIKKMIQNFGIGNGYELSGDLILSKTSLEKSEFLGYLKGKHFELMGSVMETLLSEIQIRPKHIALNRFNISDVSGIFSMHSIELIREKEHGWELQIPQLVMTDFRPSLLKKIGKCPTRIKPLTIRNLYCHNVRGILGKKESFTAKGELNFINTFKRDAHILDIPFEILGRLGLDIGLLVPVRGSLEFAMLDGRVYFTHLKEAYSEGKRSQFFFSPSDPSYIDLQGNLNIHIKMKQFVLLKVTEPFTLHLGGTFGNLKYSLR